MLLEAHQAKAKGQLRLLAAKGANRAKEQARGQTKVKQVKRATKLQVRGKKGRRCRPREQVRGQRKELRAA